jgi:hypothetical protein
MPVREASLLNYLRTYSNDELKKLVNFTVPACNIYMRVYSLQALLYTQRAFASARMRHKCLVRDLNSNTGMM